MSLKIVVFYNVHREHIPGIFPCREHFAPGKMIFKECLQRRDEEKAGPHLSAAEDLRNNSSSCLVLKRES